MPPAAPRTVTLESCCDVSSCASRANGLLPRRISGLVKRRLQRSIGERTSRAVAEKARVWILEAANILMDVLVVVLR